MPFSTGGVDWNPPGPNPVAFRKTGGPNCQRLRIDMWQMSYCQSYLFRNFREQNLISFHFCLNLPLQTSIPSRKSKKSPVLRSISGLSTSFHIWKGKTCDGRWGHPPWWVARTRGRHRCFWPWPFARSSAFVVRWTARSVHTLDGDRWSLLWIETRLGRSPSNLVSLYIYLWKRICEKQIRTQLI